MKPQSLSQRVCVRVRVRARFCSGFILRGRVGRSRDLSLSETRDPNFSDLGSEKIRKVQREARREILTLDFRPLAFLTALSARWILAAI